MRYRVEVKAGSTPHIGGPRCEVIDGDAKVTGNVVCVAHRPNADRVAAALALVDAVGALIRSGDFYVEAEDSPPLKAMYDAYKLCFDPMAQPPASGETTAA